MSIPFALVAVFLRRLAKHNRTTTADVLAVETTRNPAALVGALAKLDGRQFRPRGASPSTFDLWFVALDPRMGMHARPALPIKDRLKLLEAEFGVVAPAAQRDFTLPPAPTLRLH